MKEISNLTFPQLKNAEHVSFHSNVRIAIDKIGVSSLRIPEPLFATYGTCIDTEQDIVNRAQSSIYTQEMKDMDDERDRLFRLIHLKMEECSFATPGSDTAKLASTIERYFLAKYGKDVCTLPYQEETAVISGFILDVNNFLGEEGIETLGIERVLASLEAANHKFADMYNERVTEKSGTDAELTKKLRGETEEQYHLLCSHIVCMANIDSTAVGQSCASLLAIINQIIADARFRLNVRLGKSDDNTDGDIISPVK